MDNFCSIEVGTALTLICEQVHKTLWERVNLRGYRREEKLAF